MSTSSQLRQAAGKSGLPVSYEFGPFVLDTLQHALLKHRAPVDITPKTYDTLLVLLQNNGRMLSKEELMQAVWPDSFVEESNLTQQVSMIRKALGESATEQRYVITVPGRGYRFTGDVRATEMQASGGAPGQTLEPPLPSESNALPGVPLPPAAPRTSKRRALLFMAAFSVFAVAILAITKFVYLAHVSPPPLPGPRSLAILPLQNRGQDSSSDFLGLSLADVLITKLAYVNSLSVRPSAAIEKYRGATIDLQKVAADLKVDTLLTGSFIRDGENLRITYQLIDAKTEKILGQGVIDLKYDNLLAVQDRVTGQLISELELRLSPSEVERLKPENSVTPLAYEYFLQGLDFHGQHKFPLAIKMLEKSTQIDPNYAPAWAYLGASYNSDAAFELGGREQYRRAQAAYERALTLRPNLLDAQVFLANLLIDTGRVEEAVPLLRDALKTNGNYAAAHWELGYAYRFAGMLDESVAECERARQLAPLVKGNGSALNSYLYLGQYQKFLESLPVDDSSFMLFYRGFGEFYEQHFDLAARDFDRAYELDPSLYAGIGKALSDSIHRQPREGLDLAKGLEGQIRERGVGDPEGTYKLAQAYAVLGDKTSAVRVLRLSVESGFFSYPYINSDPLLNDLHGEPQFDEVVRVAYQRYQAFKSSFFR
jgi:DNA-binding winged helix-turn-helix (wHTH) protein/TolB-like protein/Tfp pilus assembly protein PilF